jgi:DNA (cytosine-5)-methyltransferase 1
MTFGSLFAGIGGFDLGLERAGMECAWQVEIDGYARRVLERHWPDVRRWDDVRTFPPDPGDDWRVDVLCGGFPCQDISLAGRQAGIDGERSGLWSEFARIIGVLRPRYVIVENVAALVKRGLSRVIGDLVSLGYDAEWDVISAQSVGAPHIRERLWIVAYANGSRCQGPERPFPQGWNKQDASGHSEDLADADGVGRSETLAENHGPPTDRGRRSPDSRRRDLADADSGRVNSRRKRARRQARPKPYQCGPGPAIPHADVLPSGSCGRKQLAEICDQARELYLWGAEPPVCGMAHGVPNRAHRLRVLGNSVVPVIPEWIGRQIMIAEAAKKAAQAR